MALQQVRFRYPDAPDSVLAGISIQVTAGETIGIMGTSGAGKSTLVDVILGLLSPTSGAVLVNGTDIRSDVRAWQSRVGYVPQTIYLVDDSIERNVALGISDPAIDKEAVWRALAAAQLDGFVRSLPDGLSTVTGERGVRLSGGQRQRIGLARALYQNPDVLVLDEATSALDHETEAGVMKSISALHGLKTIVIVAHRLTTLSACDAVYRLDGGVLVKLDSSAAR